jgi:hypothetical protein
LSETATRGLPGIRDEIIVSEAEVALALMQNGLCGLSCAYRGAGKRMSFEAAAKISIGT